jgi:succinate dehydrogenase/fumarate reductase-like Fe-S protein
MRKSLETATDKNAHRFLFDSRDRGTALRLPILSEGLGVFRCHTILDFFPNKEEVIKAKLALDGSG